MNIKPLILLILTSVSVTLANAQRVLTMEDAINVSIEGSPELRKSALNLERYQKLLSAEEASLRSQFYMDISPLSYDQSRQFDTRLSQWYTNQSMSSTGTLSISQPIVWTGATVSLNNRFAWRDNSSTLSGGNNNNQAFSNSLYLSLEQPLFTYNRLKQQLSTIQMDYENAMIDYSLKRLELELSITTQFYAVYTAQQNLQIAKEEFANAQQNHDIINEKVNLNVLPRSELFQAELNLSTAQSSVENSVVSLESTKDNLKQILGLSIYEDIIVSTNVTTKVVHINQELAIENALTNRLELRQREILNELSEYELIRITDEGKFSGSLSLSVGIMGDDVRFENVYNNPTNNPSVQLTFRIPIFDWGARKDRIKSQHLRMDMSLIDEEQELITIELSVRQTCRSLANLMSQIELARKNVGNAQQTYDLNVIKYREGEITGLEMSQFQSQLSTQKMTLSQRMIDYRVELLNLKVVSLYDFEANQPISPMLIYSPETYKKVNNHKQKRK